MVLAKGADTEMGSYSKQLVSFAYHKDCKQEDVGIYWNFKKSQIKTSECHLFKWMSNQQNANHLNWHSFYSSTNYEIIKSTDLVTISATIKTGKPKTANCFLFLHSLSHKGINRSSLNSFTQHKRNKAKKREVYSRIYAVVLLNLCLYMHPNRDWLPSRTMQQTST